MKKKLAILKIEFMLSELRNKRAFMSIHDKEFERNVNIHLGLTIALDILKEGDVKK